MYGEYSIGEEYSSAINGISIVVKRLTHNLCYYERNGVLQPVRLKFSCRRRIGIYPVAPLHTPFRLTQLIYVRLVNPIAIAPGKTLQLYIYLPVEIGVFALEPHGLIDVFSPETPKYGVYGTPEQGVIGRIIYTEAYSSRPPSQSFRALSLLIITNSSNSWVNVTRIIIPGGRLRYHYSLERVFGPRIFMNIESPRLATVMVRDEHYMGTRPGPYPESNGFRYVANNDKYVMIWGV